jgi:hypothetical protein
VNGSCKGSCVLDGSSHLKSHALMRKSASVTYCTSSLSHHPPTQVTAMDGGGQVLLMVVITCLHLPVVFNCLLYMLCLSLHATCLCMCWSLYCLCCFVSFVDAKRQVFKVRIPLLVPSQDSTLFYTINVPWELKRSVFFSLKSVCVILKELWRYSFAYFFLCHVSTMSSLTIIPFSC